MRLGVALAPFQEAVKHLRTMPGVKDIEARVIVAEVGVDMTRFATAWHMDLLGGLVSGAARECRQTALHAAAKGSPVAQDYVSAGGLGGGVDQGQLTSAPSPCASKLAVVPRRLSWLWPPPCSRPRPISSSAQPYQDLGGHVLTAGTRRRRLSD